MFFIYQYLYIKTYQKERLYLFVPAIKATSKIQTTKDAQAADQLFKSESGETDQCAIAPMVLFDETNSMIKLAGKQKRLVTNCQKPAEVNR